MKYIAIIILMGLLACKKETIIQQTIVQQSQQQTGDCQQDSTGYLRINNTSVFYYIIDMYNSDDFILAPVTDTTIVLPCGVSGYNAAMLTTPQYNNDTWFSVWQCDTVLYTF